MKIVITLTSWKKRINNLYNFLYIFFKTQKNFPDIFYIWLAEDEFPNKEYDLDNKLLKIIKDKNIQLKWLPGNDKVFKRWYVYPEHYEDLVISIDDDRIYPFDLIEEAKKVEQNTILPIYKNENEKEVISDYNWICGQCIIPPKTFPLEAINEEFTKLRKRLNIECDEAWLEAFLYKNKINVLFAPMKYSDPIFLTSYFSESQLSGMWIDFKQRHYDKVKIFENLVKILNEEYNFNIHPNITYFINNV